MKLNDLPAIGTAFEGGTLAGVTTRADGAYCALVLLPDLPAKELPWDAAMAWAAGINAALPTRLESALLYAQLKGQFDTADWYWTCEEDGSCAWNLTFGSGYQDVSHKSYEGRARAVRLIQLVA